MWVVILHWPITIQNDCGMLHPIMFLCSKFTRPSLPARDTGSYPCWGWFGSGAETTVATTVLALVVNGTALRIMYMRVLGEYRAFSEKVMVLAFSNVALVSQTYTS